MHVCMHVCMYVCMFEQPKAQPSRKVLSYSALMAKLNRKKKKKKKKKKTFPHNKNKATNKTTPTLSRKPSRLQQMLQEIGSHEHENTSNDQNHGDDTVVLKRAGKFAGEVIE